jgi:hypothetical protein
MVNFPICGVRLVANREGRADRCSGVLRGLSGLEENHEAIASGLVDVAAFPSDVGQEEREVVFDERGEFRARQLLAQSSVVLDVEKEDRHILGSLLQCGRIGVFLERAAYSVGHEAVQSSLDAFEKGDPVQGSGQLAIPGFQRYVALGESLGHQVQSLGQATDLVRRAHRLTDGEITPAQSGHCPFERA